MQQSHQQRYAMARHLRPLRRPHRSPANLRNTTLDNPFEAEAVANQPHTTCNNPKTSGRTKKTKTTWIVLTNDQPNRHDDYNVDVAALKIAHRKL